jgi:hypothetical protein
VLAVGKLGKYGLDNLVRQQKLRLIGRWLRSNKQNGRFTVVGDMYDVCVCRIIVQDSGYTTGSNNPDV